MLSVLASIIIAVLLCGFLVWLLGFLPIAEPYNQIAKGLIVFAVVLYVVAVLFGWTAPIPIRR